MNVASGEGDIVVAADAEEAEEHWPDAEITGTLNQATFKRATNLKWLHSTAAGADMLMFPEDADSYVSLTGEKGLWGRTSPTTPSRCCWR